MDDAQALKQLLRTLQETTSPVKRVKLLARAWRSLGRFNPAELRRVAANAGLDRAEEILGKLADGRGRLTPRLLLQGVRKARGVDPQEVRDLVNGLRDPKRRKEMLRVGVDALEEWSIDPDENQAGLPDSAEPRDDGPVVSVVPPTVSGSSAPQVPVVASATPAAIAAGPSSSATKAAPGARSGLDAVGNSESAESSPLLDPGPLPDPGLPPAPVSVPERPPGSRATPPAGTDSFVAELIRRPLVRRLRVLDEGIDRVRSFDRDGLRGLLEIFPSGWSRRRALEVLLRARIPEDLDSATWLIDELESPIARRWCLGTILAEWELQPADREAIHARRRSRQSA